MQTNGWNKIIGHQWAVELLATTLIHNRAGHAYLFTGNEQIGKTTLAQTFAQALNCAAEEMEQRPCGRCRPCTLIAANRHPDVIVLEPETTARGKKTLKIGAIRQLQQDLSLSAYEARRKVAILPDFDAATIGASNAFLKTLEEPPENVVLLLTAKDADTLLTTITSRCRVMGLRPLSTNQIEQSLQTRWGVPIEEAYLLAHLADGRLGWAVQAAQEPSILQTRAARLAYLHEALNGNRVTRFKLADKLAKQAEQLPDVLRNWLSWWRDAALLAHYQGATGSSGKIVNIDELETLEQCSHLWGRQTTANGAKQTNRTLWQLTRNANAKLALENLLLSYPGLTA